MATQTPQRQISLQRAGRGKGQRASLLSSAVSIKYCMEVARIPVGGRGQMHQGLTLANKFMYRGGCFNYEGFSLHSYF